MPRITLLRRKPAGGRGGAAQAPDGPGGERLTARAGRPMQPLEAMSGRILIVDDDESLRESLAAGALGRGL